MVINFDYNFSQLSWRPSEGPGIPSDKEMTEVFENSDSQFYLLADGKYPIIAATGFTMKTEALKIAFTRFGDAIVFLDARKASKTDLIEEFVVILKKLNNTYSSAT